MEMTCGARKKATTDWYSEMSNRSSLKAVLYLPNCSLVLRKTVLGKDKTPSVELLLLCAGGDTSYPHRPVFAARDQCLGVHVLELRDRAPENSSELVPVPYPDMIYINHEARVSTLLVFVTVKEKTNAL